VFQSVVTVVRHGHRLGIPLGFVVHATRSDRVYIAPVILPLRMHQWIAVAFARACQEIGGVLRLCQAERIVRSKGADFQRGDGKLEGSRSATPARQSGR
jgi:hypothetical protein